MTYKILIVDDEPANLRLLERLFRRQYQIISASSGMEALELLTQHDVALIISDQRMPAMTGIEFLKRAAEMRQHTVRIILTGYTDVTALVEAINSGVVYKYVTKPWANEDLQQTVTRALQHYETNKRQHDLALHNERLSARLKQAQHGFVRLVADALDAKAEHEHGHARRTSGYATAIGRRLRLDDNELEQLSLAAFLHDIGRIGIPDHILLKNTALTDEERRIVELHSERGARMLAGVPEMGEIASAVRHHHEHYDGNGYPEGIQGEQIPLHARIIFVADAYDAMTNPRPFRKAWTHDEAIEQLQAEAGRRFDPEVVAAFCELEPIGQIKRAIADGLMGMRLLPSRVFCDTTDITSDELRQKFMTEPMLAMDMLKLANVTYSSAPTAQLTVAMTRVGEARLRVLLEQNGLPSSDAKTDEWSARALRCAVAAQQLAAHTNIMNPDDAYSLGLLHNVGEVLLANLFPEEMCALEHVEEGARLQREVEIFGVDHAQISQWMLETCGVPRSLTSAVQTHHDVMRINSPIALLMHIAHQIANAEEAYKVAAVDALGTDRLVMLGLDRADLHKIYERVNSINEERLEVLQEA
jgi:response regulator RpfG family c-di-GMP phosphodiesterase/HD-like signal output (HDOD) protein